MNTVRVTGGFVKGICENHFYSFKGIPYAAPPIGELRWKHPQPVIPWEGVRDCSQFGNPCCQAENQAVPGGDPADRGVLGDGSEDCLYVNVWTPSLEAKKLPVFIWIHGGAFCCGSGAGKAACPETFVSRGIVYVSFNYRVGLMGYFAHPELSAENEHHVSGNYAHYDQLALLKWVKENIAAFGGDPDNITVGGCSAGAGSTQLLATSPLAKGLFQKAIVMSSFSLMIASYPEDYILRNMEEMEQRGLEYMKLQGCQNLAELRSKSYEELAVLSESSFRKKYHYGTVMGISKDGYLNPQLPRVAAQEMKAMDIPMMMGCTCDEGDAHMLRMTKERYIENSKPVFEDQLDAYLETWKTLLDNEITTIANATHLKFSGEKAYAAVSSQLGREPVYVYSFCRKATKKGKKQAYHGLDTQYLFGNQRKLPDTNEEDDQVAFFVQEYWCNFIKTGNPNGEKVPEWKPYSASDREVMYLDVQPQMKKDAEVESAPMTFTREFLEKKLAQINGLD